MKKNIILTSVYGFFSILIIYAIAQLIYVVNYLPIPERFNFDELNEIMVATGQYKSLALIYTSIIVFAVSFLTNFVLGLILFWINHNDFSLLSNINIYWKTIALSFLVLFSVVLSPLAVFYYVINIIFMNKNIKLNRNQIEEEVQYENNQIQENQ